MTHVTEALETNSYTFLKMTDRDLSCNKPDFSWSVPTPKHPEQWTEQEIVSYYEKHSSDPILLQEVQHRHSSVIYNAISKGASVPFSAAEYALKKEGHLPYKAYQAFYDMQLEQTIKKSNSSKPRFKTTSYSELCSSIQSLTGTQLLKSFVRALASGSLNCASYGSQWHGLAGIKVANRRKEVSIINALNDSTIVSLKHNPKNMLTIYSVMRLLLSRQETFIKNQIKPVVNTYARSDFTVKLAFVSNAKGDHGAIYKPKEDGSLGLYCTSVMVIPNRDYEITGEMVSLIQQSIKSSFGTGTEKFVAQANFVPTHF